MQPFSEPEPKPIFWKSIALSPPLDAGTALIKFNADLTLSFNSQLPDERGLYLWDHLKKPHLSLLLDPSIFYLEMAAGPLSFFSCVDELDVKWLKQKNIENTVFIPHAIERELCHPPEAPRPYDVVFIGSIYDPVVARQTLKRNFSPELNTKSPK